MDSNVKYKKHVIYSDWSMVANSSSTCLIICVTQGDSITAVPALSISKSLSPHLPAHGSTACELASLVIGLQTMKSILWNVPLAIYTDNLALVMLLAKRFGTETCIDNKVVQRLLTLLSDFCIVANFVPGDLQVADYISRVKVKTGKTVDELLLNNHKMKDYDLVEEILRPNRSKENEDGFILRAEKNIKLIRKLEMKQGDSRRDLYAYFRSTHYSNSDMKPDSLKQSDKNFISSLLASESSPTFIDPLVDDDDAEMRPDFDDERVDDQVEESSNRLTNHSLAEEADQAMLKESSTNQKAGEREDSKRCTEVESFESCAQIEGLKLRSQDQSSAGSTCNESKQEKEGFRTVNEFDFKAITSSRPSLKPKMKFEPAKERKALKDMTREEKVGIYKERMSIPEFRAEDFESMPVESLKNDTGRCPLEEIKEPDYEYKSDYLDLIFSSNSNDQSGLTSGGQEKARQDAQLIAKCPDLVASLMSAPYGILPDNFGDTQQDVLDFLAEINTVRHFSNYEEKQPLFDNYKEAIINLSKGKIIEEIDNQARFYRDVQNRDQGLSIIKRVLQGDLKMDSDAVNLVRKSNRLGRILLDDFESLFIMHASDGSDLLFKCVLKNEGERGQAILPLPSLDLARIASRFHGLFHRSSLFTYTILSSKYFTDNMMNEIIKVTSSCHICSSYNLNRRDTSQKLMNLLDLNSSTEFCIDLKGHLEAKERDKYGNPKKFYILCAINPLTAYHQYYYLKDKKASTVAETLINNLFRTFGGITKISMDLGSENCSLIQNEMSNVYKYSCRFSNKARARSNYAENSVRRLSRFLKLVTSSGNVHDIKRNLSIIGTLVNSAYLPNFNGKTSCHMIGGSNGDANLYAPSLLIGKPP